MNKNKKFESFLDGLKGRGNDALIENVKQGFKACFEAEYLPEHLQTTEPLRLKDLLQQATHDGKSELNEEMVIEFHLDADHNFETKDGYIDLNDYYQVREDSEHDIPLKLAFLFCDTSEK